MKKSAKIIFCVVGAFSIATALFGLWYNGTTLFTAFSGAFNDEQTATEMPYLSLAFYLMSAVCIICYLLLAFFGFQFVRGIYANTSKFIALLIFEVAFFFSIGFLWLIPKFGSSIAGATGISAGGMMAQFFILFPLWAPLLVFRAAKQQINTTNNQEEAESGRDDGIAPVTPPAPPGMRQ